MKTYGSLIGYWPQSFGVKIEPEGNLNLSFSIKMYSVMCDSNDARKLSMES